MANLIESYTGGANSMYDMLIKQQADAAFGRTLAALNTNQQQQPPMPPQGPSGGLAAMNQNVPPGMPSPPGGAPPGAPPSTAMPVPGGPSMAGPPQQPGAMTMPRPPMPQMPPGPQPQGGQPGMPPMSPQGQQMGGQQPMPPMGGAGPGGGMPGQAPQVDWRLVLQKVQQANPGAPPQVLAAAVDRFMPLMNQQSQQQWKEIGLQMREASLGMQQQRLLDSEQRMAAGPGGAQGQSDAKEIAQGIISGDQPPVLTGLYGKSSMVRAELERQGFPLAKAQQEWARAQKMIMSLNGPQQVRFMQLAQSVQNTIGEAKTLADQMDQSGLSLLNRAQLEAKIKLAGNTPEGVLATRYITTINTLKEEFANLANGGYAPTEAAWALANQQINGDYGVKQLNAALDEVNRLIGYRVQGAQSIGGGNLGPNAPNRYTGSPGTNAVTGEPQDKSGWASDSGARKTGGAAGGFDRAAAKKAGYTDKEIDDYLKGQ